MSTSILMYHLNNSCGSMIVAVNALIVNRGNLL